MFFSFIIPVYNRPDEIDELLSSLVKQDFNEKYEVVIIEDGSSINCKSVIEKYNQLNISYHFKNNTGPGDSRNYGMKMAKGDYYLILDSDCILPTHYLSKVKNNLKNEFVDCFGGPDNAHETFSDIQKAINFSMTSFLTTGGIRGGSEKIDKFQPRSFNMGLSKAAFEASGGFGNIHPGEDPDLTIRLWKLGFKTKLILDAFVFHKRRIDWNKFYIQVNKFGKARPILNSWHPETAKIIYWFPTAFFFGLIFAVFSLLFFNLKWMLFCYLFYFVLIFLSSLYYNKSIKIALYSLIATAIQFYAYGIGFLQSFIKIKVLKMKPENAFPKLFFK